MQGKSCIFSSVGFRQGGLAGKQGWESEHCGAHRSHTHSTFLGEGRQHGFGVFPAPHLASTVTAAPLETAVELSLVQSSTFSILHSFFPWFWSFPTKASLLSVCDFGLTTWGCSFNMESVQDNEHQSSWASSEQVWGKKHLLSQALLYPRHSVLSLIPPQVPGYACKEDGMSGGLWLLQNLWVYHYLGPYGCCLRNADEWKVDACSVPLLHGQERVSIQVRR